MKIHDACEAGRKADVRRLLEDGVDVNARGPLKQTPLHVAAHNGKHAVAELLLEKGADVDAVDFKRMSALHLAASEGHLKVVQLLVEHRADPRKEDTHDETALHVSIGTTARVTKSSRVKLVETLIEAGSDLEAVSGMNQSPLHYAVEGGHIEIVKLLLNAGANPEGPPGTRNLVEVARDAGHANLVDILVGARGK